MKTSIAIYAQRLFLTLITAGLVAFQTSTAQAQDERDAIYAAADLMVYAYRLAELNSAADRVENGCNGRGAGLPPLTPAQNCAYTMATSYNQVISDATTNAAGYPGIMVGIVVDLVSLQLDGKCYTGGTYFYDSDCYRQIADNMAGGYINPYLEMLDTYRGVAEDIARNNTDGDCDGTYDADCWVRTATEVADLVVALPFAFAQMQTDGECSPNSDLDGDCYSEDVLPYIHYAAALALSTVNQHTDGNCTGIGDLDCAPHIALGVLTGAVSAAAEIAESQVDGYCESPGDLLDADCRVESAMPYLEAAMVEYARQTDGECDGQPTDGDCLMGAITGAAEGQVEWVMDIHNGECNNGVFDGDCWLEDSEPIVESWVEFGNYIIESQGDDSCSNEFTDSDCADDIAVLFIGTFMEELGEPMLALVQQSADGVCSDEPAVDLDCWTEGGDEALDFDGDGEPGTEGDFQFVVETLLTPVYPVLDELDQNNDGRFDSSDVEAIYGSGANFDEYRDYFGDGNDAATIPSILHISGNGAINALNALAARDAPGAVIAVALAYQGMLDYTLAYGSIYEILSMPPQAIVELLNQ